MKKTLLTLAAAATMAFSSLATTTSYECSSLGTSTINPFEGPVTVDEVTFTFSKGTGGNATAYYASGTPDIRMYANNVMTVKAADGFKVDKIVFTMSNVAQLATLTPSLGTVEQAKGETTVTWTGSASELTLTVGAKADFGSDTSKAGQFRFSKIEVTYSEGNGEVTPGPDPVDPNPNPEPGQSVTFDFLNNNYGLPNDNNTYVTDGTIIKNGPVNVELSAGEGGTNGWRLWSDGLREMNKQNPYFVVSVTNGTVTGVSMTVANNGLTFTVNDGTDKVTSWTGSAASVKFTNAATGNYAIKTLTVTYELAEGSKQVASLSFSETSITVEKGATVTAPTLTATTNGAITYSSSNVNAVTVDATSGALTVVGIGGATITATSAETEEYFAGSASYTVNVVPGADDVLTVAEALAAIANGFNAEATVAGFVSQIEEINTSYGNATYYIVDAMGDATSLEVYRGYGLNGEKFTSEDQLKVGAKVIVNGTLVLFGSTPEFTTGSKILSYTAPDTEEPEQPGGEDDGFSATFDFTDQNWLVEEGVEMPEEVSTGTNIAGFEFTINNVTIAFPENNKEDGTPNSNVARIWLQTGGDVQLRVFAGDNFTISVPEAYTITQIKFTCPSGYKNFDVQNSENGTLASDGTFTPTENTELQSVTFAPTKASRINDITVKYTGSSSVADIETEDTNAPVEYFNLQGVRVANPENGLFIRRQGNNVSKVVIR